MNDIVRIERWMAKISRESRYDGPGAHEFWTTVWRITKSDGWHIYLPACYPVELLAAAVRGMIPAYTLPTVLQNYVLAGPGGDNHVVEYVTEA